MKSKIALLSAVCLCVLCVAALAVGQVAAGTATSANVAPNLVSASGTDGASGADLLSGASIGSTTGVADTVQVKEAVDRFRYFFELQDADRLKSESWPSMSPKAYRQLKNTFKTLSQITLQESCFGAPVIVTDSAEWTCSERFGYEFDGRPGYPQTHALQFHLKKVEGKWYVEGRTVAER
jgi:hypothetical protein